MTTRTAREFSLRRCGTSDAPVMADLGARLFAEAYGATHPEPELSRYLARSFDVTAIRDAIADADFAMFVAEDPMSRPIGYASLRKTGDLPEGVPSSNSYEIARFYVEAAAQRCGIGAALMEQCLTEAGRRGADSVWLQVSKEAPWAIGFYQRMGFAVVGSAPFCFGGSG